MKQHTTVLRSQGTAATAAAMRAGMTNRPNDDGIPLKPVMCRASLVTHGAKQMLSDFTVSVAHSSQRDQMHGLASTMFAAAPLPHARKVPSQVSDGARQPGRLCNRASRVTDCCHAAGHGRERTPRPSPAIPGWSSDVAGLLVEASQSWIACSITSRRAKCCFSIHPASLFCVLWPLHTGAPRPGRCASAWVVADWPPEYCGARVIIRNSLF